jgi:hypothetical protein
MSAARSTQDEGEARLGELVATIRQVVWLSHDRKGSAAAARHENRPREAFQMSVGPPHRHTILEGRLIPVTEYGVMTAAPERLRLVVAYRAVEILARAAQPRGSRARPGQGEPRWHL